MSSGWSTVVQIKRRAPYYCNRKLLLLLLVVWGHLAEETMPAIPLLETVYRLVWWSGLAWVLLGLLEQFRYCQQVPYCTLSV